jgi:hypothetical protein
MESLLWLSENPVCEWFGIQCNVEGFVESTDLFFRTIVSRIPKEIGLLYNFLALKWYDTHGTRSPYPNDTLVVG